MAKLPNSILSPQQMQSLVRQFKLSLHSVHGPAHWMRVRKNGLMLSELTGANARVVELFAVFHDSCRVNDYEDPDHGPRAAELAHRYFHQGLLSCTEDELQLLVMACMGHTHEHTHSNITVATCWDADRLDLPRCHITVDPNRLATKEARSSALILQAERNAEAWLVKQNMRHSHHAFDQDDGVIGPARLIK